MNPLIQFKPTIPHRNRERQDSFAQLEVITMKIMQSPVLWKSFHRNNIESPLRSLERAFLPLVAAVLTLLLSTASSATFTNNGLVTFTNTATAGDSNFTNNSVLIFDGSSTAGNGTFNNGTINTSGGFIQFGESPFDAPAGGNATFNNLGSASNTV